MRYLMLALALVLAACGSTSGSCSDDPPGSECDSVPVDVTPLDTTSDGPRDVGPDVALPCDGLCGPGTTCDGARCVPIDAGPIDAPAEASTPDVTDASTDASPIDVIDVPPACVDTDGDGYGQNCARGPDCDDHDRERHPGATERCNGLDDDCDGTGDVARSDALDAWCTDLWRTAYRRSNLDPTRDHAYCLIPPVTTRPGELNCHPTRVACAATAYNPSTGCLCFTADDTNFSCP